MGFIEEMTWRGLIQQATHPELLAQHLANPAKTPRRAYAGFDPTANSLTIGNLVGVIALVRFQLAGHQPVVVMGGGTGLIGDPSGKSAERQLLTAEQVAANVESQRGIFERVWANAAAFSGKPLGAPPIRNNHDWLGKLGYLEVLRDVGKHFSVNMMIQKDSVKARLTERDQGISYTEFSYMILQAYDYYHLWKSETVTLQMGGSDQFGNIVVGADLIDKRATTESNTPRAFGLTWPLVTKADGGKFGKTETGAIWLSADRTSPYAFYQFWLNSADADVLKFIRIYTLLSKDEVENLERQHAADPGARPAHRALAKHMTMLLHGSAEAEAAEKAAAALFSGEVAGLPEATLREVFASVPSSDHAKAGLSPGTSVLELLVATKLAASKREAKEFLAAGSVVINGARKAGVEDAVTATDLLYGSMILLRRGKKNWHLTRWA